MQFVCKSHSINTRWSQSISDSTRMSHQSKTTISSPRTMKTGTSRELKRRRRWWCWWRKEVTITASRAPLNPRAQRLGHYRATRQSHCQQVRRFLSKRSLLQASTVFRSESDLSNQFGTRLDQIVRLVFETFLTGLADTTHGRRRLYISESLP